MATTALTTRAIPRHKKPLAIADGVVMWAGADASTVTTDPQLSWGGTGAPTHTAPQYSIHIRGDNSATATWYRNTDGAGTWELIPGDSSGLLALNNVWTGTQDFGVSGTGVDVTFYGDTATRNAMWDQSANSMMFNDNAILVLGTGSDDSVAHDGTLTTWTHTTGDLVFDNTDTNDQIVLRTGTDDINTGVEFRNNSDAAYFQVNPVSATAGRLLLSDNSRLYFGDGADIGILWDGTNLKVSQSTVNSLIEWGVDGAGIDQKLYGDSAGAYILWDQSADAWTRVGAVVDLHTQGTTGTGAVIDVVGPDLTHGVKTVVLEVTLTPAAIETALLTLPANSCVDWLQANIQAALTAGGTTTTVSFGITGDVDAYGTMMSAGAQADLLTQNGKADFIGRVASGAGASLGVFSPAAVSIKMIGAATGGASAGDTALSVGSVKVRIGYRTIMSLANA